LFYQLLGSSGFLASTQAEYQKLAASCAAPAKLLGDRLRPQPHPS
jgi:hypothetical protein